MFKIKKAKEIKNPYLIDYIGSYIEENKMIILFEW